MEMVLKRPVIETILSVIFCFVLINYIEAFTFDRLVVFYTLLILVTLKTRYLSLILLFTSIIVSEKVLMVIGPLLFLKVFFLKDKKYKIHFIVACISVVCYFLMIYCLKTFYGFNFSTVYDGAGFHRLILDFKSKSHISNSILPIFFCFLPYLIFFIDKKKYNLNFSGFEFLLPLIMIFLGTGGGEHNLGRYAMHTFIVWLPLFVSQLNFYIKYLTKFNEK
tara:strand:- start:63 stop:725 length:663 start_codon:yes stop_codon:yes gene_type:complete